MMMSGGSKRLGGDDQVAADLRRVLHLDVEAGPDAGADDHRRLARQLAHGRPARVQDRRHDRRDDDTLNGLQVDLVQVQQVFQLHAVLVGRFEQVRRHAGLHEDPVVLHTAEHDVGIADIDR